MPRLAFVLSQSSSANPAKRKLEEDLVTALILEPGIDVTVVPHLYDLPKDGTGWLALTGIGGHLVVASWLFTRATRWTLDRHGIRGHEGVSLLKGADEEDEEEESGADEQSADDGKERVADRLPKPNRKIYCLDLRTTNSVAEYVAEVRRISKELNTKVVDLGIGSFLQGAPKPEQLERFHHPTNEVAAREDAEARGVAASLNILAPSSGANRIEAETARRWYPVIDYSRCTNCMECIDFCLFGVYGVDKIETILVEQPDNCRKGCPACSRVCPENAIIFPQHKTAAIAGADGEAAGAMKIDLSQLFGGAQGESAEAAAVRERDEQLLLAGRATVGFSVGMPKRQIEKPVRPKDELDLLMDQLEAEL